MCIRDRADRELRQRRSELRRSEKLLQQVEADLTAARAETTDVTQKQETTRARIGELEKGPEARAQQRMMELSRRVDDLLSAALRSRRVADDGRARADSSEAKEHRVHDGVTADGARLHRELN